MKRLVIILLFLLVGGIGNALAAGSCCQLPGGVQESILGVLSPEPRRLSLQFTYSFTLMDRLKEGSSRSSLRDVINEGRFLTVPTRMEMTLYTLTAAYGFSPRFSAFVSIPYVRNTMDMATVIDMGPDMGIEVMKDSMDPVKGIGDVTVMGLYRLYTDDEARPYDAFTVGIGVKTPTGSSTEKSESGRFVHAHMQPGTGSWDPLISLIYTKTVNPFLFQADAAYQISTRNSEGYKFGDSFSANLLGKYAATRHLNISGGVTYLHLNRASDKEGKFTDLTSLLDDPANTGGDSIWVSPGIQLLPIRDCVIDIRAQFPVWQRVNGIQLVSSYRILLGLSYSF